MKKIIKVFVDSNILISSVLYPGSIPFLACAKAIQNPYSLCTSDYCLNEVHSVFNSKFQTKLEALNIFLFAFMPYIEVVTITDQALDEEFLIRDIDDRKVYRGAIEANATLLLTGDKDLLDASLNFTIIKPKDFLDKY